MCCGLTWITTGQLTGAKRILSKLIDEFNPIVSCGIPIVGLETSCTAVLRSDLRDLFPDDPRAGAISEVTYTLAGLLTPPAPLGPEGWTPPRLDGEELVVQPHCRHHAVMGYGTDIAFLETLGAHVTD